MEMKKNKGTIQSLETGFKIIHVVAEANRPLRFADIQEKTQLLKSNLYKYMATLTGLDLLYRDKETGFYYLGSKLIQLGMQAVGSQDTITRITPYLQSISQYSNCTALFSANTSNGPIVTKINYSDQILNIGAQIGTFLPPSSSSGKTFHVFARQQSSNWKDSANNLLTIEDDEYQQIINDKIAFAKEPIVTSVSSLSIPIFSYTNELIGIITVVGFAPNLPSSKNDALVDYLLEMQEEISQLFGYHPDRSPTE